MYVRTFAIFVVVMLFTPGCFGGSSGDAAPASGRSCAAYCENACGAFEACDIDAGGACMDDCVSDLGAVDCGMLSPLDRLTCAELETTYACAEHCAAVCQRATECGSFDPDLCVLGCADDVPSICNAASAAERDCDQIKVEARPYEERGRSLVEDSDSGGSIRIGGVGGGPRADGLCRNAGDCSGTLACSEATNTCSEECASDAECARSSLADLACVDGACAEVECTEDLQCVLSVCDLETNTCIECREDADCTSGICDAEARTCGDCREDADCTAGPVGTRDVACDVERLTCVQCFTDVHCAAQPILSSVYPACDADTNECVECTSDDHCSGSRGVCDGTNCVGCRDNEDCQDPTVSTCDGGTCLFCGMDDDCAHLPDTPYCGNFGCVECRTAEDCLDPDFSACEPVYGQCVPGL